MSMRLGGLLVAAGLVTQHDVDVALERQLARGGPLGENLVELGFLERGQLDAFLQRVPTEPATIEDTGVSEEVLLELLLKLVYVRRLESIHQFEEAIKLPSHLVTQLTRVRW